MSSKIAIVIPTIRKEMHAKFISAWFPLIEKHNIEVVTVWDGDNPIVEHNGHTFTLEEIMGDNSDLISKKCAASRNLGFAYVAKYMPNIEYIYTLDDDEEPVGDPIEDHLKALEARYPISWFSTTIIHKGTDYMRGFPYGVRTEAEAVVSHGVWINNPDYDAPTQLHADNKVEFYKGVIPKGVFFPFCGMNIFFRRKVLPLMYYAPVGDYKGAERFDDIWAGLELKKEIDELGLAIVTGYATTDHTRASNVFHNLEHEAVGIRKNEEYWKGEYDEWYLEFINKRKRWNVNCSSL
jgi:hypothetical protein